MDLEGLPVRETQHLEQVRARRHPREELGVPPVRTVVIRASG